MYYLPISTSCQLKCHSPRVYTLKLYFCEATFTEHSAYQKTDSSDIKAIVFKRQTVSSVLLKNHSVNHCDDAMHLLGQDELHMTTFN